MEVQIIKKKVLAFLPLLVLLFFACEKGTQKLCIKCSSSLTVKAPGKPDQVSSFRRDTCGVVVAELDKYLTDNNYTRTRQDNGQTVTSIAKTSCRGNPE